MAARCSRCIRTRVVFQQRGRAQWRPDSSAYRPAHLHITCPGGRPGPDGGQGQQSYGQQQYSGNGRPGSGPPPGMGGTAFVPGKIFIGGLANTTTKEMLESYCAQWQVVSPCLSGTTAFVTTFASTSALWHICVIPSLPWCICHIAVATDVLSHIPQGRDVGHRAHGRPRLWLCDVHRSAVRAVLPRGG